MGPAGLTAVFGMGTGVAPQVWSPEIRPRDGQVARPLFPMAGHDESRFAAPRVVGGALARCTHDPWWIGSSGGHAGGPLLRHGRGGPIGVVKLLGC